MRLDLKDRIAELPFFLHPPGRAASSTWSLSEEDRARVRITWPTRYQWAPVAGILETLKCSLMGLGVLELARTAQEHAGATLLHCTVDGERHLISLDYSDYPEFINERALAQSSLYFKGQFRADGYSDSRITPAGYTVTHREYYRYYQLLRQRFADDRQIDVHGRFGFRFQGEFRRRAIDILTSAVDIHFVGDGKVRPSRFLREVAASRLSLHMPGNGPFTHRVAEFLGLGTCMIAVRFKTALHVPLEPQIHYVEIADDLSDLLEKCRYYLAHDDEREEIARAGRDYFDRYLHSDQLASYFVRTLLDRIGSR